jgi:hypothetical protein
LHTEGERTRWFEGSYLGSPTFRLRVQRVEQLDVRAGWHVYDFSHAWSVHGSDKQRAIARGQSSHFTSDLAAWLEGLPRPLPKPAAQE